MTKEIYIVKSQVLKFFKNNKIRVQARAIIGLNEAVEELMEKAIIRARENKRKTIKRGDF